MYIRRLDKRFHVSTKFNLSFLVSAAFVCGMLNTLQNTDCQLPLSNNLQLIPGFLIGNSAMTLIFSYGLGRTKRIASRTIRTTCQILISVYCTIILIAYLVAYLLELQDGKAVRAGDSIVIKLIWRIVGFPGPFFSWTTFFSFLPTLSSTSKAFMTTLDGNIKIALLQRIIFIIVAAFVANSNVYRYKLINIGAVSLLISAFAVHFLYRRSPTLANGTITVTLLPDIYRYYIADSANSNRHLRPTKTEPTHDIEPRHRWSSRIIGGGGYKHVIKIFLESARADVWPFDAESFCNSTGAIMKTKEDITPFYRKLVKSAARMDPYYSVAKYSIKSQYAANCGVYPSSRSSSADEAFAPMMKPCIPHLLHRIDPSFVSASFQSTIRGFDSQSIILENTGFQKIYGAEEILLASNNTFQYQNWMGYLEEQASPAIWDWVTKNASKGKRLFANIYTAVSHHPFKIPEGEETKDYISGSQMNGYLNTIRLTDKWLEGFFDRLASENLLNDTLVIITGDHGAFTLTEDKHRKFRMRLQETEFRTPFLIYTRETRANQMFQIPPSERHYNSVDILPTIMDALGYIKYLPYYEGKSVFRIGNKEMSVNVGFIGDGTKSTVQNGWKVVGSSSWYVGYNLQSDPYETYEFDLSESWSKWTNGPVNMTLHNDQVSEFTSWAKRQPALMEKWLKVTINNYLPANHKMREETYKRIIQL